MIDTLEIKNFKSILALKLDCKRINIFIGEPNAGKSNILESLGLLSFGGHETSSKRMPHYIRYENTANLFHDNNLDQELEIAFDTSSLSVGFKDGSFTGSYRSGASMLSRLYGDYSGVSTDHQDESLRTFRFYRFQVKAMFEGRRSDYLLPPDGDNLVSLLMGHKQLRSLANDLFSRAKLRLNLRPQEHKLEVVKQFEDVLISYPYHLISDTLQRLVFYLAAIRANKESVLIFEEPEAHAFPYYTKYLGEMMALDENKNQYFISTHNPYFLLPVLEKAAKEEVAVFVTYYEDYETKVRPLSQKDIEDSMEIDIFSNLDRFLDRK